MEARLLELIGALCWALHHLPEGNITVTESDTVLLAALEELRARGLPGPLEQLQHDVGDDTAE